MSSPVILAVNAGSGTIKIGAFTYDAEQRELARSVWTATDHAVVEAVLGEARKWKIGAIGHRLVHGGPDYATSVRITPEVLVALSTLVPFAPNHLPAALALIGTLSETFPSVPQVACFDTAFHATLPPEARRLPVPTRYAQRGIRRYGFHGLSCRYAIDELRRTAGDSVARGRVAIAHLGNGSSVTATRDGESRDTTMGFTPIGGVIMATRTGDMDPGALTYIARLEGWTPDQLEDMSSHQSGLAAIAEGVGDMQSLLSREQSDESARLAIDMYVISVAKAIAGSAAVLGGLDGIVFTGGIGEHAAAIRQRICDRLDFLDAWVRVIPANEELVIARDTWHVVKGAS